MRVSIVIAAMRISVIIGHFTATGSCLAFPIDTIYIHTISNILGIAGGIMVSAVLQRILFTCIVKNMESFVTGNENTIAVFTFTACHTWKLFITICCIFSA